MPKVMIAVCYPKFNDGDTRGKGYMSQKWTLEVGEREANLL